MFFRPSGLHDGQSVRASEGNRRASCSWLHKLSNMPAILLRGAATRIRLLPYRCHNRRGCWFDHGHAVGHVNEP